MSSVDVRSQKTAAMYELMQKAGGETSLREENIAIFSGCTAWEQAAMVGCAMQRAAAVISHSLSRDRNEQAAASAPAKAANILDGVPGLEERVSSFRRAPTDLGYCDWHTVAAQTALYGRATLKTCWNWPSGSNSRGKCSGDCGKTKVPNNALQHDAKGRGPLARLSAGG